jgi:DNA-directed RNA polymerase specialized sigma24 family protein
MKYITAIYGHPHQIMPSHIVITSPWFDTREVHASERTGIRLNERAERRSMVVKLREHHGLSYREIGEAMGVTMQTAEGIYRTWKRRSDAGSNVD